MSGMTMVPFRRHVPAYHLQLGQTLLESSNLGVEHCVPIPEPANRTLE